MKYLKYLNEKEEQMNEIAPPDDAVQLFFSDLDLPARTKILDAIDEADDDIDVHGDKIIKEKIEETLSKTPLIILRGGELIKKMNFNF